MTLRTAIIVSMRTMSAAAALPALALLTLTACGTTGDTSTATPTTPTVVGATTETFNGTVNVGSSDVKPFTVTASGGQLLVTLTAAGPPPTIIMGLGVGTYANSTCTLLSNGSVSTAAGASPQLSGAVNAGSYCVQVSDVGNQTAPVTYSVTVVHY
jgi:hypothetical protein